MMKLVLHTPHRLAKYNRIVRTGAFAFSFLTFAILWIERGRFSAWEILSAIVTLLIYPHLAYLYTRVAADAKRAEQNNLYADAVVLGAWAAQIHFALWPSVALLIAVCLNSAGHGYIGRLVRTLAIFGGSAIAWGAGIGYSFVPDTGPLVTTLTIAGILMYASAIGLLIFIQNKNLLLERHAVVASEQQFRFIADNVSELVAMLDTRGEMVYANARFEKQFGPSSVDPGAQWLRLVHPDEQRQARDFLQSIVASAAPGSMPLRLVSADGIWYLIDCKANPVLDESGRTRLVVMICKDLSRLLDS